MKKLLSPKINKEKLYLHFAKACEITAQREKRYAEQARFERKFSEKDKLIALHRNQIPRLEDDALETEICMDFYNYRMGISNYYTKVAKYYRDLAIKERKKRYGK